MNCDLVVLYSGGADSTLLLNLAKSVKREPLALMIDYNQLHGDELFHAKKYVEKFGKQTNIRSMQKKLDELMEQQKRN